MVCLLARVAFNCQPLTPYIFARFFMHIAQVLAFHVDACLVREHLLCLWTLLCVGVCLFACMPCSPLLLVCLPQQACPHHMCVVPILLARSVVPAQPFLGFVLVSGCVCVLESVRLVRLVSEGHFSKIKKN